MTKLRPVDRRITVGSRVTIINAGNAYTSWHEMADTLRLTHYGGDGPYDRENTGEVGLILSIEPHRDGRDTCYGIRYKNNGKATDYIVNQDGIKFYATPNALPEELFTL